MLTYLDRKCENTQFFFFFLNNQLLKDNSWFSLITISQFIGVFFPSGAQLTSNMKTGNLLIANQNVLTVYDKTYKSA